MAAPLEQSALSQRTALKIGGGAFSAAESGRSVLRALAFLARFDRFDTCTTDLIKPLPRIEIGDSRSCTRPETVIARRSRR